MPTYFVRLSLTDKNFSSANPVARKNLPFRILMLLVGTAFASFGIALTTTSGLGTTPISSVPWTITAITGLSFGTTTFLINLVFYILEVVLLRSAMPKWNILQLPAVFVFSVFIDAGMMLARFMAPSTWLEGLAMSLVGNLSLAFGILLQVRSKTLVQPGEGAVLAISVVYRKAFGSVKVFFDCFLVASAACIGWFVLSEVIGIREGTLISAVLVGTLVKLLARLFPEKKKS